MIQIEEGVKECIKNDHKGCQILAVDLSEKLFQENDQNRYYCVKCLIEKIGVKKIVLYDEAKNKAKSVNEELKKKNTVQQHQKTKENFQKLSEVIKLIQGEYQNKFEDLKKQLEAQINNEQKMLQSIQESATSDVINLQLNCYQENGNKTSPSPNIDYKEITEILVEIKKIIYQFENFEQLQDEDKEIIPIEQSCSINLQMNENKRIPALDFICESHKMEIIMFNLNQIEFEQTNPFLCVECAQDLLTRGNEAVANTISLKKADEKWNEYIKDQTEKRLQRQSILYLAIGFITKLKEKYNQELNKMIQSFDDQLNKSPKEYEQLIKLKNTRFLKQGKQSLHEIIKILSQNEQSKKQEQIPNQEDSQLLDNQKKVLGELIKENLIIVNSIQQLQNHHL